MRCGSGSRSSISEDRAPGRQDPRRARRRGTPIGPYDVLIAGQALARGLTLVTRNTGEFAPRCRRSRSEDWEALMRRDNLGLPAVLRYGLVCLAAVLALLAACTVAQAACTGVMAGDDRLWRAATCRGHGRDHLSRACQFSDREPGRGADRHRLQRPDPRAGDARHRDDEQRPHDALHRQRRARRQIRVARLGPGRQARQPQPRIPRHAGAQRADQRPRFRRRRGTTAIRSSCSTRPGCASPISATCTTR